MRITVRYFQATKRLAGVETEQVELADGSVLGDLIRTLEDARPALASMSGCLLLAVNAEHCGPDRTLSDGDEVAVMPPFSGG